MNSMRTLMVTLTLLAGLAACAAHPKRINCEEHLQPINTPAPVLKPEQPRS
jgi:flagellar basal body L-ring protein FlgH